MFSDDLKPIKKLGINLMLSNTILSVLWFLWRQQKKSILTTKLTTAVGDKIGRNAGEWKCKQQ